ncbi:MAG: hypothetical protein SV375_00110 [Thermodesulfobacteriota bacterium]|nr:hypothetical protein [Thermodesulfobacteriota bacterium]
MTKYFITLFFVLTLCFVFSPVAGQDDYYSLVNTGRTKTVSEYGEKQVITGYRDVEVCSGTSIIQSWESGITEHNYKMCVKWETIKSPKWEHPIIGTKEVPIKEHSKIAPKKPKTQDKGEL